MESEEDDDSDLDSSTIADVKEWLPRDLVNHYTLTG